MCIWHQKHFETEFVQKEESVNERGSQTFSWVSENAEEKSMPGIPQFLLIVTN